MTRRESGGKISREEMEKTEEKDKTRGNVDKLTVILLKFNSLQLASSLFNFSMASSTLVSLGGSKGSGLNLVALVMPPQPTPMGLPLLRSEAWYCSWFIIEWKPRIAVEKMQISQKL